MNESKNKQNFDAEILKIDKPIRYQYYTLGQMEQKKNMVNNTSFFIKVTMLQFFECCLLEHLRKYRKKIQKSGIEDSKNIVRGQIRPKTFGDHTLFA